MATFRSIAKASGLEILHYSDATTGHLERGADRMFRFDRVTLRPHVVIADPSKTDRVIRLLQKAESACLISRSVASEIVLDPPSRSSSPNQHRSDSAPELIGAAGCRSRCPARARVRKAVTWTKYGSKVSKSLWVPPVTMISSLWGEH